MSPESPRQKRNRLACPGKRAYPTRKVARKYLGGSNRNLPGSPLKVYHCTSCGMYHLGREPRGKSRDLR